LCSARRDTVGIRRVVVPAQIHAAREIGAAGPTPGNHWKSYWKSHREMVILKGKPSENGHGYEL